MIIDWGDAPTWVSSVAAISALAAAIWAGYTAKRLYEREAKRDAEASKAARRSQATCVAAWLESTPDGANTSGPALYVRNGSSEPVYDVEVVLLARDQDGQLLPILPQIGRDTVSPSDQPHVIDLPPSELVTVPRTNTPAQVCIAIAFTDTAGVRWRRDHRGRLVETDENSA